MTRHPARSLLLRTLQWARQDRLIENRSFARLGPVRCQSLIFGLSKRALALGVRAITGVPAITGG